MYINRYLGYGLKIIFFLHCLAVSAQVNGDIPSYFVYVENGLQGVKDDRNDVIIPAIYEEVGWTDSGFEFHEGVTGYKVNGLWGLISRENERITKPVYTELSIKESGIYIIARRNARGNGKELYGLVDNNGDEVIGHLYSSLRVLNGRVVAFFPSGRNFDKAGLLDLKGDVIIPFEYMNISRVSPLRYYATSEEGKGIIFNDSGAAVARLSLDSLGRFENGQARIWKGHLTGLIDRDGNISMNPTYREIRLGTVRTEAVKFDTWLELDVNNEIISSYDFDAVDRLSDSSLLVSAHGRSWIIDNSGERISDVVSKVREFEEGIAPAAQGKKWGAMDNEGNWVIPPRFEEVVRQNGFFVLRDIKGMWRVMDRYGVVKIPAVYNEIGEYHKLHFPVRRQEFWGLVTRTGETAVNCVFDSLSIINSGLISVKFKGLFGIIDLQGNWVLVPDRFPKTVIDDRLYMEIRGDQKQIRTFDGDIIYFTDNRIELYNDYFLERLSNGMVWKINFDGVIESREVSDVVHRDPVVYSEFEDIFMPSEGFTGIRKDGKYGFVDDQNRLRIANRYDSIQSFHEGYAAIKLLGRWGFVDRSENLVIQPIYDAVGPFRNGKCIVKKDGKVFLIDKDGRSFFTTGFDELLPLETGNFLVRRGLKYGLISNVGEMLVNFVYDEVRDLGDGRAIVRRQGKYGVMDMHGMDLIPRIYDGLEFDNQKGHFFARIAGEWEDIDR